MPHPVDIHVGKRVQRARQSQGMSQSDLGARLGVSFQQVQKYEKGTNRIGSSRLFQTAKALQVPISHFFEGLEDAPTTETDDAKLSRKAMATAAKLHQIGNRDIRVEVIRLIDKLADAPMATAPAE